ncbi:MAG: cellulase family glycosylhydrolase [Candidatus Pedobacter colombiensis]|uniref:Cellulase family glycosylhydrolase n=1 Tax=Candidatus Pedobacter colombiensis TaxID=3121371 RepID=A0AAJ5W957_9SPHI|nr:cellulase family glycosylhydrolase [Pedobacter sp.]WEK21038.1 MAG: cellulase family glycosylhydrolase [Pedobacter sp.]
MMFYKKFIALAFAATTVLPAMAQSSKSASVKQGIYVDAQGIIRWEKNREEAAFFGVNYTAPFAYGYRSINRLGMTVEQAIKDDVYHFSRLGLDAFRVHVWDTEISDVKGNLLNNEHLRLFDFLIAELKKRNIKTIVTPIAFWGNGYPEKDQDLGGFSSKYGKREALVEEQAFLAQENYLKQFFKHKNQYTGLTYQQDPDVIATEVNNEPQHSGPKERTTEYINRMVKAIRSTGWTKPVFYNISESPKYADAIVKADVQGHTFQWYPSGLVAGHTQKGNFLPNVSKYPIPFDSIPGFKNRAKMVYEFDAADILGAYMYPAMARSFRTAGFQWATQFAYDPMATASSNVEYQTHYLNMAYTPAKAISLLIASKAFHKLPRLKSYPQDTLFDAFRLDYTNGLSEMNTPEEFYYSNTTDTKPVDPAKLKNIAGVGSSEMVKYDGSGAYFIDRLENGVWRLEVMPDAVFIRDPFERTSPQKDVARVTWKHHEMDLSLPNLGTDFTIKGINKGNHFATTAAGSQFSVSPGVYILTSKGQKNEVTERTRMGVIEVGEFVAPKQTALKIFNPETDREKAVLYNPDWKNKAVEYIPGEIPVASILRLKLDTSQVSPLIGLQYYFGDQLALNSAELPGYKSLVIKARTGNVAPIKIKLGMIAKSSDFFAAEAMVGPEFTEIEIPLNTLTKDAQLLLPRPYPGFLPLYFKAENSNAFNLKDAEKLEITFGYGLKNKSSDQPNTLEIESIYLK